MYLCPHDKLIGIKQNKIGSNGMISVWHLGYFCFYAVYEGYLTLEDDSKSDITDIIQGDFELCIFKSDHYRSIRNYSILAAL